MFVSHRAFGQLLSILLIGSMSCGAQAVSSAEPARQTGAPLTGEWIATWGTAQQMVATAPNPGEANDRIRFALPTGFADQTIRMNFRVTTGGPSIRLKLSNAIGNKPLPLDSVHVARSGSQPGETLAGTDHPVTFGGQFAFTIPPGVTLTSDPVAFAIQPGTNLSVSIYARQETGLPTNHLVGSHTSLIGKGDQTTATSIPNPTGKTYAYLWLAGVDVEVPSPAFAVVAFGDSITDGYGSTLDKEKSWPNLLAERIRGLNPAANISVINEGISGNQVLQDGAGVSALARFDHDVLSQSGVRWVILLEGINDINLHTRVTPGIAISTDDLTTAQMITGYKQLITRAHAQGIKVMGATLTPEEGISIASAKGERIRNELNAWIRTSGSFDAVVDFDKALRDETHPARIRQGLDSDHIHPNDGGYQVMAGAVPLLPLLSPGSALMQASANDGLPPLPPAREEQLRVDWANLQRYRAADEQLPAPDGRRVVFMGDSITENWAKRPELFFPGRAYVGRGISGQTTPQMLVRFQQDVVALKPAVVVINGGTNDIAGNTGPSSLRMIEDNLSAMVELAQANHIQVVLASITPAAAYPWNAGVKPIDAIAALNRWMREYCAGHACTFADYFSAMADQSLGMKAGLSVDDVHPNAEGYAVMSPIAEKAIGQALARGEGPR